MSGLDPRALSAAIKTAIRAQLAPHDVYEYGQVPGSDGNAGTLPNIFAIVSLERRFNPDLRVSAEAGVTSWRLAVRLVGRSVAEAQWAAYKTAAALNEKSLPVAADYTSPLQFESDQAPQSDDGRFSTVASYTFTI